MADMRQEIRNKWACRTISHLLASELGRDLCGQIREKRISTEEQCLDWLEQEEGVHAPNQTVDHLWSIPPNLGCGEFQLRDWRRYLRKYRRLLKQVEDWSDSRKICHLLRDVLPSYWRKRLEDEKKKRTNEPTTVRIMSLKDQHPRILEYFWRDLAEPGRLMSLKNSVYVEVVGDRAGGRVLRLKNVE